MKVRNATGEMVPIGTVATFKDQTTPYRCPVTTSIPPQRSWANLLRGVSSGAALSRIEELAKETLPPGITFEWTDLAYQQAKKGIPTVAIFGASALFVFLVLAAQYESWKIPLAIVLIVPMCLLAATTGLHIRTMPIDILAQIGFVVLLGLAAKNAILIVEFAKQWQDHEGVDAQEAAVHSARVRLRPILMTSLAFIAGVAPLAVAHGAGAEMRQSLGTTVFFGMLGVTVFGLLFTPAFYALVRKAQGQAREQKRDARIFFNRYCRGSWHFAAQYVYPRLLRWSEMSCPSARSGARPVSQQGGRFRILAGHPPHRSMNGGPGSMMRCS